jgi:hypothetical protein
MIASDPPVRQSAAMPLSPATTSMATDGGPTEHTPSKGMLFAAGFLLVLTLAAVWVGKRQMETLFSDLDAASLRHAQDSLDGLIEQQRVRLIAAVRVLAEDTRIRSTGLTTGFDEGTIRDVLEDVKKASNVNVMAVLDESGKVRAITGAEGLRHMDLSSSPVIKAALEAPASYFWTLPDQVLIISVAPIHTGPQVSALLLMGVTLGAHELTGIQRTLGVSSAIFTGDRMIASSSNDPALGDVFRTAIGIADGDNHVVPGHQSFLSRVTRTNDSATAAKIVWLVPRHIHSHADEVLRIANWAPALFATVMFALVLLVIRKRYGGV